MNRSLSITGTSAVVNDHEELRTFDHISQQYGTWLGGYPWQYFCTGTYRRNMSLFSTEVSLRGFMEKLGRALGKVPVAYYGALERRTSGLGMPAIPAHWHFVFAVPEWHRKKGFGIAAELWRSRNGFFKIRRYDPQRNGAYYISKLAAYDGNLETAFDNLDRLAYNGPQDLFDAAKANPYVPDHVKHLTSGEALVLRRC